MYMMNGFRNIGVWWIVLISCSDCVFTSAMATPMVKECTKSPASGFEIAYPDFFMGIQTPS